MIVGFVKIEKNNDCFLEVNVEYIYKPSQSLKFKSINISINRVDKVDVVDFETDDVWQEK